ncbi:type II toxin-antitoxin system PemK/MazF family toxin [Helicobacter bizzozeronii]|uniref:type II toxin-antitoxin system PemK/MazF family toxin n=1 Tax=Helicobacter bizzozeronii TaxID=56877 RepID=UPI000CEE598A|nr:type II toxin-antitoxin system PemK/MazF family toxin [Helicobacter bizzozeronii]
MTERFDSWNEQKKKLDKNPPHKVIVGNIYWICIGQNIGHEVYGKSANFTRPVLVVKLLSSKLFLGVPLSSQIQKRTMPFHHNFKDSNGTEQVALLHQIRVFDTKRRRTKIAQVGDEVLKIIKDRIKSEVID